MSGNSFLSKVEIMRYPFKNIILLLVVYLLPYTFLAAQNELYIKGAEIHVQEGGFIHVEGDVHLDQNYAANDSGRFNNDGVLIVRGDMVFESDRIVQHTNGTSTEGIVRLKNYDAAWNTRNILANKNQFIIVKNGANANGRAAFHILELENEDRDGSSVMDNYVALQYTGSGGTTVEVKQQLMFNNVSRIVTDDAGYSAFDGDTYDNTLYISNPAVTAIAGASNTPGAVSKYVEGKLSREIAGINSYYFPIGLQPSFVGSDGMEAFELNITNNAVQQTISTYVNLGEQDVLVPYVYCDIGDNPGILNEPFSGCTGAPDGIQDFINLNTKQSHEWIINNSGVDFNYDIEVFPGTGLNNTAGHASGNCGSNNYYVRFLGKDGVLNGTVIPAPDPFTNGAPNGYDLCPPASLSEGNILTGQTGFSTFRIYGALDNTTILPVELVSLSATPINNSFIEVEWVTASELNNDYFELQRSTDAIHYQTISVIPGHGTTSETQYYDYDDDQVVENITYYYRLKQVDFDGTIDYSDVVNATISVNASIFEFEIYPNPTFDLLFIRQPHSTSHIDVYSNEGKLMHSETTTGSLLQMNWANFPPGLYMVSVQNLDNGSVHIRKIVKVN